MAPESQTCWIMGGVLCPPVQSDGAETEHGDGTAELLEEPDGLAHDQSVKPPAATWTDPESDVKGNAGQSRTDPWACQVPDEAAGDRFEDARGGGTPQHRDIACGGEKRQYGILMILSNL